MNRTSTLPSQHLARCRTLAWRTLPAIAALALGACASAPPPTTQMAVSSAAVERASGPSAAEAPAELASARQKIVRANQLLVAKDNAGARRLAEEAEADAALAEARARETRSEAALNEVRDSIRQLRAAAVSR